jgi:hypothetical protein
LFHNAMRGKEQHAPTPLAVIKRASLSSRLRIILRKFTKIE